MDVVGRATQEAKAEDERAAVTLLALTPSLSQGERGSQFADASSTNRSRGEGEKITITGSLAQMSSVESRFELPEFEPPEPVPLALPARLQRAPLPLLVLRARPSVPAPTRRVLARARHASGGWNWAGPRCHVLRRRFALPPASPWNRSWAPGAARLPVADAHWHRGRDGHDACGGRWLRPPGGWFVRR